MKRADIVSIVEAAYAVDISDEEWMSGLVRSASALDAGLGLCGYLYDISVRPARVWSCVNHGSPLETETMASSVQTATDDYIEKSWKTATCATASEVPGYEEQPAVDLYFRPRGIADMLALNAYDPSGVGVWLGAPLRKVRNVGSKERQLLSRVAAHIATAFRLRRRIQQATARVGAVVDPRGRVDLVAGGLEGARSALRDATLAIEKSRGRMRGTPERAVAQWRTLVSTQWTLVDQFESDGRRYVVAKSNEPVEIGPELLTPRERQVLAYAALGHTNKHIAYELGIAPSTVRVLLVRAAKRLRVRTREELLDVYRAFGKR